MLLLVCRDDADGDDGGDHHSGDGQQKLEKECPSIPFENVAFHRLQNAILNAILWGASFVIVWCCCLELRMQHC